MKGKQYVKFSQFQIVYINSDENRLNIGLFLNSAFVAWLRFFSKSECPLSEWFDLAQGALTFFFVGGF